VVAGIPPHEDGFDDPVDPQPRGPRARAYNPGAIPSTALPAGFDHMREARRRYGHPSQSS
jgi:hypothetical protein